MRPAYYACVFLEATGLTHICWVLSHLMGLLFGMKDDLVTTDLKNASDILDKVEISLDDSSDNNKDAEDPSTNGSDASLLNEAKVPLEDCGVRFQVGRFTGLVKNLSHEVSPDVLRVIRHYLDTHPEKFQQFPSVVGNKMYPSPSAIAEQMKKEGYLVPKFLTDISHPEHIPPHIVASELMTQNRELQQEIELLKRKLCKV